MMELNDNMRTMRIVNTLWAALFFSLTVVFLHVYAPVCRAAENKQSVVIPKAADARISADLAWAESDGNDYEIFISTYDGNAWSSKIQITDNFDNDIVPAVIRDNSGILWVIWTRTAERTRHLYFRFFDGQKWSEEDKIETGFAINLSAAMAVDSNNQIWLVWVSFDGVDDDIFFSRWNGAGWSSAMRVNTDDSTPDIQPVIGIGSNGLPWVRWSGFEDEDYRIFESRWSGNDWGQETLMPESTKSEAALSETDANGPASSAVQPTSLVNARPTEVVIRGGNGQARVMPLPYFLSDPWKAGICIENSGGVTSQPLRTLLNGGEPK